MQLGGVFEQRLRDAASAASLSPVSVWALIQIDPQRPISQKDLAARLHCTPSTVVDPADRLERRKLVRRRPDPEDRRKKTLVLTAEGQRVRDEMIARLFAPPTALRRASDREQRTLSDLLLLLRKRASR